LHVRRATAADIPAMMDLERQSASAAHWSAQQYESLFVTVSGQQQSERVAWIVEAARGAPEIQAFLIAHRVDAEWELENIVVAANARRKGVGAGLLSELVEYARTARGAEIFLEVRESNAGARSLYRKMGFEEKGLRKSYYSDPAEDAILCRLKLC
jgi:ribosomal-protein-alanine N-acetyltransferase